MPSPNVNSILINPDPQIKYYNVHDLSHLTDNTEENEEENEDQSVIEHDDDSDYEDQDDTSHDQDQDTPPIQPSGMNINLPFSVINTMKQCDIFQV
eukprot:6279891-Ditylum_brightwellii.AAC.1